MLKIKNNVDLEVLERFGFEKYSRWNKKYDDEVYSFDSEDIGCYCFDDGAISIDIEGKEERKIRFNIYNEKIINVLYDLITVGAVEKVDRGGIKDEV